MLRLLYGKNGWDDIESINVTEKSHDSSLQPTAECDIINNGQETVTGDDVNGLWTATETVNVKANTFTAKSGLAYRVGIS